MQTPLHAEHQHAQAHADAGDIVALMDVPLLERAMVEQGGLREYTKLGWHVMQPGKGVRNTNSRKFQPIWGWHHDAVSDHFEAFIRGEITRLIVNIPPRHTKSTLGSIAAPTYGWILDPSLQFLTASYRDTLSTRDAVKSRRVIQSQWFQDRWGDIFRLAYDQNQKTRYENDKGGHRLSQSVAGGSTGEGGDRIIADDPHNTRQAVSEVERQNAIDWWDDEMQDRLNDPLLSGLCIIMQRLHEQDLSGHVLAQELNYVHLMLPARYEPDRSCHTTWKGHSFKDPRTTEDEPLDVGRFPEEALEDQESRMSAYAWAGKQQQRPAPRKGAMFDADLIRVVDSPPAGIGRILRYWDKAGTDARKAKGRGAHTAGALMAKIVGGPDAGKFIIMGVIRGQWEAGRREAIIKNTAEGDGVQVHITIEQEPGSGGLESVQSTIKNLAGYVVKADRPTGDKTVRAEPMAAQMDMGNIMMLRGSWNADFLDELRVFPVGSRKDQVDAAAGAFNKLAAVKERSLVW